MRNNAIEKGYPYFEGRTEGVKLRVLESASDTRTSSEILRH